MRAQIKDSVKEGITRYVHDHCPTGSFLQAVLENDLQEAVACADEENATALADIVRYCYWEIPHCCWGSKEAVARWLEIGRQKREKETTA